jgi:hypothetical protein
MIQLKYILSFAALLAYVGAYTPEPPRPVDSVKFAQKGEKCGGLRRPELPCLPGLECKQKPTGKCRRKSDSIQKRSEKSVGRKKCQNGGEAESKEGQPCATDAECGHGFECDNRKMDGVKVCV